MQDFDVRNSCDHVHAGHALARVVSGWKTTGNQCALSLSPATAGATATGAGASVSCSEAVRMGEESLCVGWVSSGAGASVRCAGASAVPLASTNSKL